MKIEDLKVCVLRVGGTNCDAETKRAFTKLGVQAETLQVSELIKRHNILDYNMLVLRYCNKDGEEANGKYPANPNGSFYDIAGICNPEGNIFGLMPHPERAMYWWQQPDWTRESQILKYGDGKLIFQSIICLLYTSDAADDE